MAAFAHVARMHFQSLQYLAEPKPGRPAWVAVAAEAAVFDTVRDATRAALRLPSRERAFALPAAGSIDA